MHLSGQEEKVLDGEEGESRRRAMELLVALGDIAKAERLVEIGSAQISGASYKTISGAGVEFLEELSADARASVRATLNPLGMDRENWRELGISEDFARVQLQIVRAYERMGVELTCTCTPYLVGNRPSPGEHISWAESSAVIFANSVLGARTNRESGPSALAAAIIGKTPLYGLHIEEERRPRVWVRVETEISADDYTLLGHAIGKRIGQVVPLITGMTPGEDDHKALGAAMAASGAASIYHFDRAHDACGQYDTIDDKLTVERDMLEESAESLNTATEEVDMVTIGCPHLSRRELAELAGALADRKPRKRCDAWFCVSRDVARECPREVGVLREFGHVACDTCMVVAPLEEISHTVGADSAKAATYLPTLCRQKVRFATRKELLELISE